MHNRSRALTKGVTSDSRIVSRGTEGSEAGVDSREIENPSGGTISRRAFVHKRWCLPKPLTYQQALTDRRAREERSVTLESRFLLVA